jgi:hypothetical protein
MTSQAKSRQQSALAEIGKLIQKYGILSNERIKEPPEVGETDGLSCQGVFVRVEVQHPGSGRKHVFVEIQELLER